MDARDVIARWSSDEEADDILCILAVEGYRVVKVDEGSMARAVQAGSKAIFDTQGHPREHEHYLRVNAKWLAEKVTNAALAVLEGDEHE